MEILHQEGHKKGRFYTADGLAEIVYSPFDEHGITILHTEVDPSLEGKGIGKQLVAAVVAWARDNDKKVQPVCVFAKAVFDRTEDYKDVLYQG